MNRHLIWEVLVQLPDMARGKPSKMGKTIAMENRE